MAAPISDEIAQKIFNSMEEQSDAHKKMGSHLTKLEESKLKKPPRVEVLDEEEGEDWDERDKANYERKKQFGKLTVETIAMREKRWRKCNYPFVRPKGWMIVSIIWRA